MDRIPTLLIVVLLSSMTPLAAEEIRFNRDIRPILSDKCFACHGPDGGTREAELRLDLREDVIKDRAGHQVVAPGDLAASELARRIGPEAGDERMPPAEHGKPLTERESELLTRWIQQGASYEEHWSLTPVRKPTVPKMAQNVATAVDAFILRTLETQSLAASPPADPRTLIRRLSFDLTGLPPTPEQVEKFASDPSDQAYREVVEQMLQSPHFGERLAMYWLDLVRYADTLGFHGDQDRSVSPYRDYVIDAFNQNKPFDEFVTEQIAGDLLPNAGLWQKVASTYNRLNRASAEGGVQPKEYYAKYAADRVRTAGSVFLGTTFGCAECHDHKFDPFTTKDFYSFAAFFADIKEQGIVDSAIHIEQLPVPTPEQERQLAQLTADLAESQANFDAKTPERLTAFAQWQEAVGSAVKQWQPLKPVSVTATGGAEITILEDGLIVVAGKNPDKQLHSITLETDLASLSAIQLELVADPSLPANGPGRAANGNFVINRVDVSTGSQKAEWAKALSTHDQNGFPAQNLVTGQTGWAILPEAGKKHQLILVAKQPLTLASSNEGSPDEPAARNSLVVTIEQKHGDGHNLGRFRLHGLPHTEQSALALIAPEIVRILATDVAQRTETQSARLWDVFREQSPAFQSDRDQLTATRQQLDKLNGSIVTTLASKSGEPRTMRVLPRGNWMDDTGTVVLPAVPHFLPQPKTTAERLNRLDLARWLVSPQNPLVARTFVNRLWMLFFGQGICRSVDDLGSQGEWPTHPELLDWLAADFVENGWDIKQTVRAMVLSNTYRQSSRADASLRAKDPYNRTFARQSRWRLEAEMVRDNALAVSGLLVDELGGASVRPYQPAGYWDQLNFPKRTYQHDADKKQYRRGLYTHWQRTFLHPSLLAFDAPAREECTARRDRSNTPQQALVLLNDPTYVEAARVFAARVLKEGGDNFDARLDWAYRQTLSRSPEQRERTLLHGLFEENHKIYQSNSESATKLLSVGIAPIDQKLDAVELASWTAVTRAIFNLHETITRY